MVAFTVRFELARITRSSPAVALYSEPVWQGLRPRSMYSARLTVYGRNSSRLPACTLCRPDRWPYRGTPPRSFFGTNVETSYSWLRPITRSKRMPHTWVCAEPNRSWLNGIRYSAVQPVLSRDVASSHTGSHELSS